MKKISDNFHLRQLGSTQGQKNGSGLRAEPGRTISARPGPVTPGLFYPKLQCSYNLKSPYVNRASSPWTEYSII
jgi:hypothetical protein